MRPYQIAGMQWLDLLARLGLGCLPCDDMGLGNNKNHPGVVAAAVLKNEAERASPACWAHRASCWQWAGEIGRFAPSLKAVVVNPSGGIFRSPAEWCGPAGRRPRDPATALSARARVA